MNSYEKARDEAANVLQKHKISNLEAWVYWVKKNPLDKDQLELAEHVDILIQEKERLQPELEALRAAVRSAYDALDWYGRCNYDDSGWKARAAIKKLKPFLEPAKLPLDSETKEGALPISSYEAPIYKAFNGVIIGPEVEIKDDFEEWIDSHTASYNKGVKEGLEKASEHLLRLAERTDAGHTQGIGVALVRAAREILELGKGEL